MTRPDVVITGLGATTPIGGDVPTTWEAILAGRSGTREITADWPAKHSLPVRIAAQLLVEPGDVLDHRQIHRQDRCSQVAMVAAREAWADAGLDKDPPEPGRVAVVVGTGFGCVQSLLSQNDALHEKGLRGVVPQSVPMIMSNGPAAYLGLALQARAGVHAPMSACASGAEALALAFQLIRSGVADVVLAGGAEACITPIITASFVRARSMSTRNADPERASRPFDTERDGFVLAEGAGMLVLERQSGAVARGARAYGRLAGAAVNNDAYHITAPDPTHAGQVDAITRALRDADLSPDEVGHVNAHATSTPVGDTAEAGTIRKVFGPDAVVTAPKGALGHMLGASGAVEAIISLLSLTHGLVPPTANLAVPDDGIDLDLVRDKPRQVTASAALSQSFGFGGHNVALAFTTT